MGGKFQILKLGVIMNVSNQNISEPFSVLTIGSNGGRGRLYAQCVEKRNEMHVGGIVKSRHEPDLSHFSSKPRVYEDLTSALQDRKWDIAIVSVPHFLHHSITSKLIEFGVKLIIKEKPLAISSEQVKNYLNLIENQEITIVTTTQRIILPSFLKGLEMLSTIGEIHSFEYVYHFALSEMTTGWRANKEQAIGGVLLDMGYHALDVLHLYFGCISNAHAKLSYAYKEMADNQLEDKAEVELFFGEVKGFLSIDRYAQQEQELFKIKGSRGTLEIGRNEVILYNTENQKLDHFTFQALSKCEQIHLLFDRCINPGYAAWRKESFKRNIATVEVIEQMYKTASQQKYLPKLSSAALSIKEGSDYEHYKGLPYKILGVAQHSETYEELVVYQAQYGEKKVWVRPIAMFLDNVNVNGKNIPRFKFIECESNEKEGVI